MSPSVSFDPPVTIEECLSAENAFGEARAIDRPAFESQLIAQLDALEEILKPMAIDQDHALAAFD
jgi:hypothetical protein